MKQNLPSVRLTIDGQRTDMQDTGLELEKKKLESNWRRNGTLNSDHSHCTIYVKQALRFRNLTIRVRVTSLQVVHPLLHCFLNLRFWSRLKNYNVTLPKSPVEINCHDKLHKTHCQKLWWNLQWRRRHLAAQVRNQAGLRDFAKGFFLNLEWRISELEARPSGSLKGPVSSIPSKLWIWRAPRTKTSIMDEELRNGKELWSGSKNLPLTLSGALHSERNSVLEGSLCTVYRTLSL